MPRQNNLLHLDESEAYRSRIVALGWTQNEAARRIKKDAGLFSRWITGKVSSAPMRKKLDMLLAREEAKRGLAEPAVALGGRRR